MVVTLLYHNLVGASELVGGDSHESLYVAGVLSSNYLDTDTYSKSAEKNNAGIMLGYRFSNYVAVEGFLENHGEYRPEFMEETISFKISSINTNIVGILPVSDNVDLLGSVGFGFYFQSNETNAEGETLLEHDIGFGQKLGVGLQYRPIKSVSIRLMQNLHFTMISNINNDANRLKQISSSNLLIKYHFF